MKLLLEHDSRLPPWLPRTWTIRELEAACLASIYMEPLSWVDTYRYHKPVLEGKEKFAIFKAESEVLPGSRPDKKGERFESSRD